jgi:hypothetical protein
MITGNYALVPTADWKNVQYEDVFLSCDTTLADVNISLPPVKSLNGFWATRIHILSKLGNNKVNILAYTTLIPTPISDYINGVASITMDSAGDSCIVTVADENNWVCALAGGIAGVPELILAASQVSFINPIYTNLPMGTTLTISDYNTTNASCTLVKKYLSNDNYQDWIIIATTDQLATGKIGDSPIP